MKIRKELPLFEKKRAFMIVTGKQSAKIYIANSGEINLAEELDIPSPSTEYTDNEGHFKSRGNGMFIASGNVREPKKAYLTKKFTTQLSELVSGLDAKEKAQELYLFTPDYMKNELRDGLSKLLQERIVMNFSGNYGDSHVFELLEMIKEKESGFGPIRPTSKRAQKLIEKKID